MTLWTPWCNKLSHRSQLRCSTSLFQHSSECRKWKRSMVLEIPSIILTLTRIKWSYMGIRTLYDAELSLSIAFVSHFIEARTYRKPSYHLLTIKQSSQESMRSYFQRFNAESLKVDIPDEKFAIIAFIVGLGV